MKFCGPSTRIKQSKRAIEVLLLFLLTAYYASGFQRQTSVSLNTNVTLRASPPSRESKPDWDQSDSYGQPGFTEATTEVPSTPSMGTTCYLHSYLLPIFFVASVLFLC
ncbi:hypothetical protein HOLleu_12598 [Holothuria leucospilota]|uniref:Uncharacterized protein n=1 Tax=Holothuria leucospilota TaxID=206669 RepID=A0A9Q1CBI6_HOLLE|nr:hypothetical protein HOLleu_12598 [Holothuria leucospilota]